MRALLVFLLLLSTAFLPSCTYNVAGTPTYESSGVARLYDFPRERRYKNLGLHSWGFYRPSFSEPTLADVWTALSEKVRAIGGDACIVRYEKVGNFSARTLEVTCEVLKVE
jgi:hypothetical protein